MRKDSNFRYPANLHEYYLLVLGRYPSNIRDGVAVSFVVLFTNPLSNPAYASFTALFVLIIAVSVGVGVFFPVIIAFVGVMVINPRKRILKRIASKRFC